MRPLIYGYVQVLNVMDEANTARLRKEIEDYAEREGYCLAEIFVDPLEWGIDDCRVFMALIEEVQRAGAQHVVVPALYHFSRLPGLRLVMRAHLEHETGAKVVVLHPASEASEVSPCPYRPDTPQP